jgi:hypothetical protein
MTASLGASVLVILTFFTTLGVMLTLAVHMESTLEHPRRPRHRHARVPVRHHEARANVPAPGAGRSHPHL